MKIVDKWDLDPALRRVKDGFDTETTSQMGAESHAHKLLREAIDVENDPVKKMNPEIMQCNRKGSTSIFLKLISLIRDLHTLS